MLKYLFNRLKEPSTWAGVAAVATALGHSGGAALIGSLTDVVVVVFGVLAAALPESKKAD